MHKQANSMTLRRAGWIQGGILSLCSTLPVMGAVLIAPLLPAIQSEFASSWGSTYLVPLILTAPALCIAVLSPFVGAIVDRHGRRRILLIALALYAFCGAAPLFLHSLRAIVVSRFLVGITEAFIMTCSTTLLGDYFQGRDRERWLSYQQALMSVAGLIFVVTGGWLGDGHWRTPFALYSMSFVFLAIAAAFLWETARPLVLQTASKFPMRRMAGLGAMTILGALVFYSVPVELGYLLTGHGVTSSARIGMFNALISLPIPVGSLLFEKLHRRLHFGWLLAAPLLLMGIGIIAAARASSLAGVLLALSVHQFGGGIMMPAFLAFAMSRLSFEMRGKGTGAWWSFYFVGQFSSALTITYIAQKSGGLQPALQIVGWSCVAMCLLSLAFTRPSSKAEETPATV